MSPIAVFALAGLASYVLRASMLVVGSGVRFPQRMEDAFGLLVPALVSAFLAATLLIDGDAVVTPDPATLIALGGGGLAVRRTGSMLSAFAVGFPVFWVVNGLAALL